MKQLLRNLPNLLTLGNLTAGALGILAVFHRGAEAGIFFIALGAAFDFMDGFAARLLKADSAIGKELDSLADMVSFGLLPGFIVFNCLVTVLPPEVQYLKYIALLVPVFSALRLAKFNIDENQKEDFIGLPTPANAFLLGGIPLLGSSRFFQAWTTPAIIIFIVIASSLLMVAPVHFFSLKFRNIRFRENLFRFILVTEGILSLVFFGWPGITPALILYIVISVTENYFRKNRLRTAG